ncbi:Glycosyl hydrolase family 5 [Flavobacterium sp. 9AF]|uniref:cellulase family glycosylhydrolase n=1 Tax=Flavobacterium sp. 9AF TaxID=2653142 RepID=UPI0012EF8EBE|nr:cellulase family glycosylhydrolase [Flavobacterium sp. 9AF]VXB21436.1 Glycosyl hydrolase family 5 [Flavobacterium sp. 9AF]
MSLINNKNSYRIFLLASFIAVNIFILFALSEILGYLNEGADRSTMLHLDKVTTNTYLPKIQWSSLENPGREMEKQTLETIEKHYLFSWYVKNNALQNNSLEGIEDYFTDNPRKTLDTIIQSNKEKNISIETTTLTHNPKLEFYSEDGQLIVFTDENVIEFQNIYENKTFITSIKDTATYKVMMLLEDGFWRIRHCERMEKMPTHKEETKIDRAFEIKNKNILKKGTPFIIKGINYYPKNSAWDMYGNLFNTDTIASDFAIIKKAKLNTIRIFVPYEDFGKGEVKIEKIEKLKQVLDLAKANDLAVIVTLFDFYSDYTIINWTLSQRHAESIVSLCKEYDNILAWDIKNEPDLDFKSRGKQNVLPWLEEMIHVVKQTDPNHLVTVGFATIQSGEILQDKVDFISFHYYEDLSFFKDKYKHLEDITKKPIVIQEFGLSSNRGFWSWFGNSEKNQASYHEQMQAIFKEKQISFLSWTLYDFPEVPNQVAGKWPWIKNKQKNFGFIDVNGNPKPSFKYISN